MSDLLESIKRLLTPVSPLPSGIFHYQAPPDSPLPYRLHLRIEPDGSGILIINASTILHLNQTATEYAFHLIRETPENQLVQAITNRYRVNGQQASQDYQLFKERIHTIINTPDLDPETFLDIERSTPYSQKISAPYRLDCALTYRLPGSLNASLAPYKRVDRELSTDEWYSVFDKAWQFGVPHIILTGGEPTLRDDLPALIEHTESNGQVVGLLSDGLRLSDSAYLQTLLQTGLDHLLMTLDPDEPASWKALESVLPADLFVAVHLTLTLQNIINTPQILDHLKNIGVKAVSLSASDPALHAALIQHRNEVASLGMSLVWNLPVPYSAFNPIAVETQVDTPASGAGHAWLYIEPDGDVLPSQGVNQVLGNILKDPIDSLWK